MWEYEYQLSIDISLLSLPKTEDSLNLLRQRLRDLDSVSASDISLKICACTGSSTTIGDCDSSKSRSHPITAVDPDMRCSICEQDRGPAQEFLCPACALGKLNKPRVKLASTLVAKEALSKQIEPIIADDVAGKFGRKSGIDGRDSWSFEVMQAHTMKARERTAEHRAMVKTINQETAAARRKLTNLKQALSQRRETRRRLQTVREKELELMEQAKSLRGRGDQSQY